MLGRLLVTARLALIALITVSVLGPAILLANLPSLARLPSIPAAVDAASATSPKLGVRAAHAPWFGMSLVSAHPVFRAPSFPLAGAPPIIASAGILVDIDTGEVLWSVNPHMSLPPASTTKVLAALVALQNFTPQRAVTITPDALDQQWDETTMGLKAGEQLSVQELLEGMLMASGNDAATAVAADTVGLPRFVAAMNAQVLALGLRDSHFATPVGLSDPQQYASPYDLAAIAAVTYDSFSLFRQIVGSVDLVLPATPTHQRYQLHNLNQLLQKYPAAVGIKPGWTGDAGACLVGIAVRSGHRLLAVLLHAAYPAAEESRLFDWAFATQGLPRLLQPTPTPKPAPSPSPSPGPR